MKLNAKQLAENLGISYVVSSGLIKLLLEMKQIELAEKVFHSSGKGKPTKVYNFPEEVSIAIKEVVRADTVVELESEPEPEPVLEESTVQQVAEEVAEEATEVAEVAEVAEPSDKELVSVQSEQSEQWYWDDEDDDDYVDVD